MQSDDGNGVSAEKSFRMKQNDRFMSRVMAKEACVANCSSRVFYYGEAAVGVPFTWETQPGTPKHPLMSHSHHTSLPPPLTPPPSYFSNSNSTNPRNSKFHRIFSSIFPRKSHVSPSPSSRSSSSSWSLLYSSPNSFSVRHRDVGEVCFSPTSTGLCCYPFGNMKNAILNIILG